MLDARGVQERARVTHRERERERDQTNRYLRLCDRLEYISALWLTKLEYYITNIYIRKVISDFLFLSSFLISTFFVQSLYFISCFQFECKNCRELSRYNDKTNESRCSNEMIMMLWFQIFILWYSANLTVHVYYSKLQSWFCWIRDFFTISFFSFFFNLVR